MARPQQPELARSGKSASDPASAKARAEVEQTLHDAAAPGPVPDASAPGHHPQHEQDRPTERFAAKAVALGARGRRAVLKDAGPDRQDAGRERQDAPSAGRHARRHIAARTGGTQVVPTGMIAIVPPAAFLDAWRLSDRAWDEIGERKTTWLARIALFPLVGSSLYAARVRPRLHAATTALAETGG